MNPTDIKAVAEFTEIMIKGVKTNFERDHKIEPMALCLIKKHNAYLPVIIPAAQFMESEDTKNKLREILLMTNANAEVLSTLMISEAWLSMDNKFFNKGAVNDPNRIEVVMINISNIITEDVKIFNIDRTNKIPILVENKIKHDNPTSKPSGRFTNLK